MKGVAAQKQACLESGSPTGGNEIEVTVFTGAVEFIAYDAVSTGLKVDSDLVHATGLRAGTEEGEGGSVGGGEGEAPKDCEVGDGRGAIGMNGLFEPDFGGDVEAFSEQRGVDGPVILWWPSPDQSEVRLFDAMGLHLATERARCASGFGD